MSQQAPRPGQATFAAWLIIGGSVILVVTAFQRISSLHTLEVQEQLQRVLSEPPFSGTGVGLGTLRTTIRVLSMVAAGAATASTILGVQALRRSTGARLALTLLAPLVLIGGFATAGFFAPMVVAGVVMLWLSPTRDWFAGRLAPPGPAPTHPSAPTQSVSTPSGSPAPTHPSAPAQSAPVPWPTAGPAARPPASSYGVADRRPGSVIAACVIVWVSCALVSGAMLLLSLVMAVARDDFFDELERQQPDFDMRGLSRADLATATYALTAIVVVWSVVAIVLAVLTFCRLAWARVALAVCTGVAGLVLLASTVASPPLVVLLAAAMVTLWLLLRADVTAWVTRSGRPPRVGGPPRR